VQLGWQIGEEGSVIMPEPLFTPRVHPSAFAASIVHPSVLSVRKWSAGLYSSSASKEVVMHAGNKQCSQPMS